MRLLKLLCVGALLCSSFSPTIAYMDDNMAFVHTEEAVAAPQTEEVEQTPETNPVETVAEEEPASVDPAPELPPVEESPIVESPVIEEEAAVGTEPEVLPPPIPENLPDANGILQEIAEGPFSGFFLNAYLRNQKRNHAESTYIEGVLRRAFANFPTMDLGTNVGATATHTIHFSTHSSHNAEMNSWVSQIAGNDGMGTPWFTHIYYGDHPNYRGDFIIEGVRANPTGGASMGIQVDYSLSRTTFTTHLTVNLRRTSTWDPNRLEESSRATVDRVALGATVATYDWQRPWPPIRLTNELDIFTNVDIGTLRIRNVPQIEANVADTIPLLLGTPLSEWGSKDFLSQYLEVKIGNQVLTPDEYDVTVIEVPANATLSVGSPWPRTRIQITARNGAVSGVVSLPIVVEWGDSVVFGGQWALSQATAAAFTLHHGERPRITSAYGIGGGLGGQAVINAAFPNDYYDFGYFSMAGRGNRNLSQASADQSVTARGVDQRDAALTRWTNREVAYGDVVRSWVADASKNVLRTPTSNEFIHHDGEVYYEITPSGYRPLNINRVVTTEQEIDTNITTDELRQRVAEFIDVSRFPNIQVVDFVSLPDTSQLGSSEGVITVSETLESGSNVSYDYTVPFNVTEPLNVHAENIPVLLGSSIGDVMNMDLSAYLEVTLDGQVLSADQYEVTFVNQILDTTAVGIPRQRPTIRVNYLSGNATPVELVLPIVVEWGDSVVFGDERQLTERTVAAFTLHHGIQPLIISAYGNSGADGLAYVRPDFPGEYYSFSRFSMSGHSNRNLSSSTADNSIQVQGNNFRNIVLRAWTNPVVNYGDVVRAWVADPAKNALRTPSSDEFIHHGGEVYYEITPSGYRPLAINRVVTTVQEISEGMTHSELDDRVKEFIDVSPFENIEVVDFASHPDTSRPGQSQGTIRVAETLASGERVLYEYNVMFDVIPSTIIDISLPKEIVFGSTDLYEGEVVSPVYTIENKGNSGVRVNVQTVDVTSNDNNLALLRSSDEDPAGTTDAVRLVMNAANAVDLNETTSNQLLADISPSQAAQFTIGGNYFGEYGEAIRLGLDIHYRFEILP